MPGRSERGFTLRFIARAACVMAAVVAMSLFTPQARAREEKDPEAQRLEMERRKEAEEKRQAARMAELRRDNPEAYQRMKQVQDRKTAVDRIVQAYRNGRLDAAAARRQLTPLFQEQVKSETSAIDERIASLKQTLQELEKMKTDPKAWVKEQVDHLLLPAGNPVEPDAPRPVKTKPAKPQ